jgi:hypothetical protein
VSLTSLNFSTTLLLRRLLIHFLGASGWRSRVSDETTNSDVVRMPQMRASDSTRSNMGSQIKLDPTVHEYLRQMSAGRDGL